MQRVGVNDLLLYRLRYVLGGVLIAAVLLALLVVAVLYVPGGLSQSEMAQATESANWAPVAPLAMSGSDIVNLPYVLVQKSAMAVFGMNTISIKLPSLILAVLSVAAMYGVLRVWFRRNVAIITLGLVVTSTIFLYTTQLGTPAIAYIFWPASILFIVSLLSKAPRLNALWIILAGVLAGLSLYTPLQLYGVIALALTVILHPHARFIIRRLPKVAAAVSVVLFALIVTPLVASLVHEPSTLLRLLGIPSDWSTVTLSNIGATLGQYLGTHSVAGIDVLSPVYGFGTLALLNIGLFRLFTAKYTAKSYILTAWLIFLVPLSILQPAAVILGFIPVLLLVAYGIDYLIRTWYTMFPVNPYARAAGLIPLIIIVASTGAAGLQQFLYGFHYDSVARQTFSNDAALVRRILTPTDRATLVVPRDHVAFYQAYVDSNELDGVHVTHTLPATFSQPTVVAGSMHPQNTTGERVPDRILVSTTKAGADRFYVYKKSSE